MGYQIWVLIDIHTKLGRTRAIAEQIAKAPEVYWAGVTTGTCNLRVGAGEARDRSPWAPVHREITARGGVRSWRRVIRRCPGQRIKADRRDTVKGLAV